MTEQDKTLKMAPPYLLRAPHLVESWPCVLQKVVVGTTAEADPRRFSHQEQQGKA